MSAFVLPFKSNIVYITIMKSDYFGEIDFVVPARVVQQHWLFIRTESG